ncbi:MAG: hypothetical protein IJ749_01975, partial [Eubacterium sp.]|nr:hypothetical protein [Eubacterium sp.]
TQPFTKKQVRTKVGGLMEDLLTMQLFGKLREDEGTVGKTRVSIRKLAEMLNAISSWSQMALNLPQRISNVSTGFANIIIESAGKGIYNAKDVAWAARIWLANSGDRLTETGKNDPSNKLSLFAEYFDLHQDNGRDRKDYEKGRMAKIFNTNLLYAGLMVGEDYLALTSALACAKNFKVKNKNGKVETLWDAYDVKYLDATNKTGAYLALKEGYTKEDGSPITVEDETAFQKQVIGLNFDLQGIYNLDDKSAVQKYALGTLAIMYRKWIAPAVKRRYGGTKYNVLKGGIETEGYYITLFNCIGRIFKDAKNQVTEEEGAKALWNIKEDLKALRNAALLNWNNMTDYEKSNMRRAFTEISIMVGLTAGICLLGKVPPSAKDDDDPRSYFLTWWDKTLLSQLFRLRSEIGSQAPTPMLVDEATRMLRSPFAALRTVQTTINILNLLLPSSYTDEIKSGRYKGHTKAYKYLREFPFISMWKKVENFVDPTPMINYYSNEVNF